MKPRDNFGERFNKTVTGRTEIFGADGLTDSLRRKSGCSWIVARASTSTS